MNVIQFELKADKLTQVFYLTLSYDFFNPFYAKISFKTPNNLNGHIYNESNTNL